KSRSRAHCTEPHTAIFYAEGRGRAQCTGAQIGAAGCRGLGGAAPVALVGPNYRTDFPAKRRHYSVRATEIASTKSSLTRGSGGEYVIVPEIETTEREKIIAEWEKKGEVGENRYVLRVLRALDSGTKHERVFWPGVRGEMPFGIQQEFMPSELA